MWVLCVFCVSVVCVVWVLCECCVSVVYCVNIVWVMCECCVSVLCVCVVWVLCDLCECCDSARTEQYQVYSVPLEVIKAVTEILIFCYVTPCSLLGTPVGVTCCLHLPGGWRHSSGGVTGVNVRVAWRLIMLLISFLSLKHWTNGHEWFARLEAADDLLSGGRCSV